MLQLRRTVFTRLFGALVLAGLLTCARAAELGEPMLRSFQSQPLVADIELTWLSDPAVPVYVRLAHPDVWKGANIRMHPILPNLTMSVMRRDNRQFLHITSTRPVETDYVHLFLELQSGGQREVRAVTLWLTPDPQPAPPPLAISPAPAPAPLPAPMPKPAPALVARAPAPARACAPVSAEQARACSQIDYKNGLLSAQIVELEEKVKLLQVALENSKQDAAPPAAAPKIAPALAAAPAKEIRKEARKKAGFNWLLWGGVGAGVLALLGAVVWFIMKRRKNPPAEPKPGWLARFRRKPAAPPAAAEPQL